MQPRYPSSSVNLSQSSRSSIRHRSGAYSPQLDHNDGEGPIQKPSVMPNMAERRHLSQQLEKILPYDPVRGRGKGSVLSDLDQVVAEPTVMLVQSRTVSDLPISSPDLPLTIDRFPQRSWTRTPITRTRTTPLEPSSFIISHHRNEYHDAEAILPFPPMSLTQHTPDDLGPAILASTTPFQKDENPENLDLPDKAPNYSRFDDENERSSDFPRTLPLRRSHLLSRTSPPMSKPATSPKKQTVTQKKKRYTVKSQPLRSSPSSSPTLPDTRMSTSTTLSKTETLKSQGSGRSTLPSYASISLSKAVSGSVSTRPSLLRSLDTTEKLTHKFPIHHRSVRNVQTLPMNCGESHRDSHGKHSHALASTILNELEERGLGMERVNRWNTYKWSLFLSVCSVFAYGLAGLVYSGLTWFRGQSSRVSLFMEKFSRS